MVFSSSIFLFAFLPLVLLLYYATKRAGIRNAVLLVFSLIFYAWGEPVMVLLLIGTMVIHELPFARALGFLALTVAAMAVILFVLVLFYTLLMQLCTFGYTLYVEIVFRM